MSEIMQPEKESPSAENKPETKAVSRTDGGTRADGATRTGGVSRADGATRTDAATRTGGENKLRGFFYCFTADLLYSLSFFFVRCLTDHRELSSDWTLLIKESTTVLIVAPIILFLTMRGKYHFPTWKIIGWTLLAGFFCEFFGARLNLWAYAMLGLVLAIPLIQTFTLLGTLFFGAIFLREKISPAKGCIALLLIAAVFLLAFSRGGSSSELSEKILSAGMLRGLLITMIAGMGYALFYVILRKVLRKNKETPEKEHLPLTLSMFLICFVGVIVAGTCLLWDRGPSAFLAPNALCWSLALGAGLVNCLAFFLKSIGLKYATASKVAFIAVVQIFCLSLLGFLFFHEETNALVWGGLALTCLGIFSSSLLE